MLEVIHVGCAIFLLVIALARHAGVLRRKPMRRRAAKHLRPYDELRLTNL